MTTPSDRDLERISASLDGQLSPEEAARLEQRLAADPQLRQTRDELLRTRSLLRRAPVRRAPRNFTLTPRMAGLRPPQPRLVPVFSWASAAAVLALLVTFAAPLVGQFSSSSMAAAPLAAPLAAPAATLAPVADNSAATGLGSAAATQPPVLTGTQPPVLTGTQPPVLAGTQPPAETETGPQIMLMSVPQAATAEPTAPSLGQPNGPRQAKQAPVAFPFSPLQVALFIAALLLATAALVLRGLRLRAFARRTKD